MLTPNLKPTFLFPGSAFLFMMQITFIGTGGSAPTPSRGLPAIAVHAKELLLFDCGEGTQRQMMRYKVGYGSVRAIFISHMHLDHYLGIFGLLETLRMNSPSPKPLHIFAPSAFYEKFLAISGYKAANYKFVEIHAIRTEGDGKNEVKIYENDEFEVSAFPVEHGMRDAFGFVIKEKDKIKFHEEKAHGLGLKGKLFRTIQDKGEVTVGGKKIKLKDVSWVKEGARVVYTGDTTISKSVASAAKGAALLIHDATFSSESHASETEKREHSSAKDAAEIAKKAGVVQLALTHISARYSEKEDKNRLLEEAKAVFPVTILAEDGLVVDVK